MADVRLTPIRRGDPRTITVSVVDPDGDPVDLSGADWHSTVRETANSTLGESLDVDVSQAHLGVLGLTLSGAQSRTFDQTLVGDLEGTTFGTILFFEAAILNDVTRLEDEPVGGLVDTIEIILGEESVTVTAALAAVLLPLPSMIGFVYHGSDPDVPRPLGYAKVEWQGTVHPNNAISPDSVIREDLQGA